MIGLLAKSKRKYDANYKLAYAKFTAWLDRLREFRVLDPACGSGNFLFLGLKALKDIEHKSHLEAAAMGWTARQTWSLARTTCWALS